MTPSGNTSNGSPLLLAIHQPLRTPLSSRDDASEIARLYTQSLIGDGTYWPALAVYRGALYYRSQSPPLWQYVPPETLQTSIADYLSGFPSNTGRPQPAEYHAGQNSTRPIPVTKTLINAVIDLIMLGTGSTHRIPSDAQLPHYIPKPGDPPFSPRDSITFHNGFVTPDGFHSASTQWFSPRAVPFDYDPTATAPTWERCLHDWFNGCEASATLLERRIGYILSARRDFDRAFMDVGQPRAGKGLVDAVENALLGGPPWHKHTAVSALTSQFGREGLERSCYITIDEADQGGSPADNKAVAKFTKEVIGHSPVYIDVKYRQPITVNIHAALKFIGNDVFTLDDPRASFWSKILFLHYPNSWLGHEDENLQQRLLAELPGIAARAVVAWRRLLDAPPDARWPQPPASIELRNAVALRNDPIGVFVAEALTPSPDGRASKQEILDAFAAWQASKGLSLDITETRFFTRFKAAAHGLGIRETRPRTAHSPNRPRIYTGAFVRY